MDTGWTQRLAILRRAAEEKFLEPLRLHGWTALIEKEVEAGEYLVLSAQRGGQNHLFGLVYSSGTSNTIYKRIASQVDHIFFNGQPCRVESFTYGINKPVSAADDFHAVLLKWNATSADGKFAPIRAVDESFPVKPQQYRMLLSEKPIEAIWLRLRQFQSVTLARKLIAERAEKAGIKLENESLHLKAEGLAHTLRNASDYYYAQEVRNLSQRILNLYYGSLAFAFAEMLAAPNGSTTLGEIEDSTKQGHGLYTVDGFSDGLEHLVVGVIDKGFFPAWMKFMSLPIDGFPAKKPRLHHDVEQLPGTSWITMERLFASIPEIGDLFGEIFSGTPRWVTPIYDPNANPSPFRVGTREHYSRSYILLLDDSARLSLEDIAAFPGPISEIMAVPANEHGGREFRVAVDHPGVDLWHAALPLHHSPFERDALIMPIFGVVNEYRAICVTLLYALLIVVRYRPSVWRRAQEGDLDHMRVLVEAFLTVVERVLPEQFLGQITGQRVSAIQPGSLFS